MVLVIGAASGGVYYMQKRIENLAIEKAELEIVNDTLNTTIEFLETHAEEQEVRNLTLSTSLQKASIDLDKLRNILSNHDLTKLIMAKPGLIETRINDGTKKVFADIVADTAN